MARRASGVPRRRAKSAVGVFRCLMAGMLGVLGMIAMLGMACALLPSRCVAQGGPQGAVAARVSGEEILQSEVDAVLARIDTLFPGAAPDGVDPATAAAPAGAVRQLQLKAAALEQLIDERLLRAEIASAGVPIADSEITAGVERLKRQVAERGTDWGVFLARSGRDEGSIREQVAMEIGLSRLVAARLDEARMERVFQERRREFDGTRLRVSHIVLRAEIGRGEQAVVEAFERAEAIRREILSAALTFDEAAQRYSAGPSRFRGGDLGWISRDGPLADEFARVAYGVGKGDLSKPFATRFGIHIVRVTDVEPGRLGLDVVREKIKPLAGRDVLREIVTRVRAAAKVEYGVGVPHFEKSPLMLDDSKPRRVVVESGEG